MGKHDKIEAALQALVNAEQDFMTDTGLKTDDDVMEALEQALVVLSAARKARGE